MNGKENLRSIHFKSGKNKSISGTQPFLHGHISAEQQDFGSRVLFIKQAIFRRVAGVIFFLSVFGRRNNPKSVFWKELTLAIPEILSFTFQL